MSKNRFNNIFYTFIFICIAITIFPVFLFDIIETDIAFDTTYKYFLLPALIISIPVAYYAYKNFIYPLEKVKYIDVIHTHLRTAMRVFLLSIGFAAISSGVFYSSILLSNHWLGKKEEVRVNGYVAEYRKTRGTRGKRFHNIRIWDEQNKQQYDFKVWRPYRQNEPFRRTIYKGKWGIHYATKSKRN